MTKLTVLHVLFNISTAIYNNVDYHISFESVQNGLRKKKYLIMKAQKFLVKESEIVIICIIYASLLWKKKDCSKGLQFLLKVLETKMFLILSAKWPENLAEKETRMISEFLYRTMFTRKNHEKKDSFFYGGLHQHY